MRFLRSTSRFALLIFLTFGVYALWFILKPFIPNKIYWRQVIFGLWSRGYMRIAHVSIDVIGTPPKPPFFLVSNHLGYIDIPVVRSVVKGIFVAKHEIREWFMLGKIIKNMGTIFVDRSRRRTIPKAGIEIIERLQAGEGVIIFPEGTSTKGESILPFNSSFLEFAAKTDTPVSYLSISYRTPQGEMQPSDAICWWDETPFLEHIRRLLSLPGFTAILNFGDAPVVAPDRKELATALHSKVSESFIPMI